MVDFTASGPHLLAHTRPVYDALPLEQRGVFHLVRGAGWTDDERAAHLFDGAVLDDGADRKVDRPLVGAAWSDVVSVRGHRPVVLMEHGAGQTYKRPNPAFAGGLRRDGVSLYLCPNEHVARLNREAYPDVPAVVVGTPMLDEFCSGRRTRSLFAESKTCVFAWHWDMQTMGDPGRSAFDHHKANLPGVFADLRAEGWTVIGTGHPKAWHRAQQLGAWYDAHGVETVRDFADVLDRADVLVADNTSAQWLSAAVGVAQVVLDCPGYAQGYDLALWPRFALPFGYHAGESRLIAAQVELAHDRWKDRGDFQRSVAEVVPFTDGACSRRAADAIVERFG